MSDSLKETIFEFETALLDPTVRAAKDKLQEFISDEFIEFGSSGKVYTRNDILDLLPLEDPIDVQVEEFTITELSTGVVLAKYRSKTDAQVTLRSSIWKLYDGQWKMMFHQGTRVQSK